MVQACAREYRDVADRRFHAQPVACPVCGPRLTLLDAWGRAVPDDPITHAAALLRTGHLCGQGTLGVSLLSHWGPGDFRGLPVVYGSDYSLPAVVRRASQDRRVRPPSRVSLRQVGAGPGGSGAVRGPGPLRACGLLPGRQR